MYGTFFGMKKKFENVCRRLLTLDLFLIKRPFKFQTLIKSRVQRRIISGQVSYVRILTFGNKYVLPGLPIAG